VHDHAALLRCAASLLSNQGVKRRLYDPPMLTVARDSKRRKRRKRLPQVADNTATPRPVTQTVVVRDTPLTSQQHVGSPRSTHTIRLSSPNKINELWDIVRAKLPPNGDCAADPLLSHTPILVSVDISRAEVISRHYSLWRRCDYLRISLPLVQSRISSSAWSCNSTFHTIIYGVWRAN